MTILLLRQGLPSDLQLNIHLSQNHNQKIGKAPRVMTDDYMRTYLSEMKY